MARVLTHKAFTVSQLPIVSKAQMFNTTTKSTQLYRKRPSMLL